MGVSQSLTVVCLTLNFDCCKVSGHRTTHQRRICVKPRKAVCPSTVCWPALRPALSAWQSSMFI